MMKKGLNDFKNNNDKNYKYFPSDQTLIEGINYKFNKNCKIKKINIKQPGKLWWTTSIDTKIKLKKNIL